MFVQCAIQRLNWIGLFHLFKLFLRYCYEPEDQEQDLFTHTYVPRPNDFSDFAEYFVRKVVSPVLCTSPRTNVYAEPYPSHLSRAVRNRENADDCPAISDRSAPVQ